ncbi:MAG TPA: transaldolase [Sutterella sp.]|nr:transaldolase [Sutterella sp.]
MQPLSELEQLKQYTTVVADTGDIDEIARVKPAEATTNPSLILKAARQDKYRGVLAEALGAAIGPEERVDRVLVGFGSRILEHIPGRVSTEVDARLSFDAEATVRRARNLIALYESLGINRSRVLIKIAATWEGCRACRILESEGIHCNMTLIFDLAQAEASAQAGATLISPFVGRIYDWFKAAEGSCWDEVANSGLRDPGVQSVTEIFHRLKGAGSRTQIMGASFRNKGEILALAGCDLLTIAPKLLDELAGSFSAVPRALAAPAVPQGAPISITEPDFRYRMNRSEIATVKLSEGIRAFVADTERLEGMLL